MTRPLCVSVVARDGVLGGAELWLLSLLDATDRLAVDAVLLADGPLRDEFARRGVSCPRAAQAPRSPGRRRGSRVDCAPTGPTWSWQTGPRPRRWLLLLPGSQEYAASGPSTTTPTTAP
jgi:hypothetical protein